MQEIKPPTLTRAHKRSARRLKQTIDGIWTGIENCPHNKTLVRVIPAMMDDHGDMIDQLVVKRCANRLCNTVLGYAG